MVDPPQPDMGRLHLVVLGSGARRAALPRGDKNGRPAPLFEDLPSLLDVDSLLSSRGLQRNGRDFEELYSDLHQANPTSEILHILDDRVRAYFSVLALPDTPTIYDYLVLALRPKDFIATFNWDPFLLQALQRNGNVAPIPHVAFLHGCVSLGVCETDMVKAPYPGICNRCSRRLRASRLLFPVKDKDYDSDPHISGEWSGFQVALEHAYILTVFGYGAPTTDAKAVELMKTAWSTPGTRGLEETEIIDVKTHEELGVTWAPFTVSHHWRTPGEYARSTLGRFPRRSCETIWNQFMMLQIPEDNPAPTGVTLSGLQEWHRHLVEKEGAT